MDARLIFILPVLICAGTLAAALLTGKALNPMRGLAPLMVERSAHPKRYWTAIALRAAFTAITLWMALSVYFHA